MDVMVRAGAVQRYPERHDAAARHARSAAQRPLCTEAWCHGPSSSPADLPGFLWNPIQLIVAAPQSEEATGTP